MAETTRPHQARTATYPSATDRSVRRGMVSISCLTLLIATLLAVVLTVVLAGVVLGRVNPWFNNERTRQSLTDSWRTQLSARRARKS